MTVEIVFFDKQPTEELSTDDTEVIPVPRDLFHASIVALSQSTEALSAAEEVLDTLAEELSKIDPEPPEGTTVAGWLDRVLNTVAIDNFRLACDLNAAFKNGEILHFSSDEKGIFIGPKSTQKMMDAIVDSAFDLGFDEGLEDGKLEGESIGARVYEASIQKLKSNHRINAVASFLIGAGLTALILLIHPLS